MAKMNRSRILQLLLSGALFALAGPMASAQAEVVLKILVVNPSETDVKEFDIHSPLPPEVKPEHVLDADGLKVDYDAQAGTYMVVGNVTLKPKESVTKRILLEDIWTIEADRLSSLRRETDDIMRKLDKTPYADRGAPLAQAVERRLADIEKSQDQPFLAPMQHITLFRENTKQLQMVESDLVSLRQLMVMAALNPATPTTASPVAGEAGAQKGEPESGGLSILATWRLIFIILGMLGFISVSFFLVWQHQLKLQLAKQAASEATAPSLLAGNGSHPVDAGTLLSLPTTPATPEAPSKP